MEPDGQTIRKGNYNQPLGYILIEDVETHEVHEYRDNGGLRGAIARAKISDGAFIEVEATGETEPHSEFGTDMRRYRIFECEDPRTQNTATVTGTDPLTEAHHRGTA